MSAFAHLSSTLLTYFLPLSLLFVAILFVVFIALPYKRVHSYKQEGVTTYFFPILGFFKLLQESVKSKGDIMASLKETSKFVSNPKFLVSHINRTPFILLQDPKYIKEFLQKQGPYHKSQVMDCLRMLAGNGLVIAEDETWKRHRKIISSSFNFEFLKTNVDVIQNTTREFFNKLTADDYQNYSAISKIQEITGEIVGRIFFGENLGHYTFEGTSLTLALADITSELAQVGQSPSVLLFGAGILKLPFISKFRRLVARVQNFRRLCLDIIRDRKAKPQTGTNDLLASLLATQESDDPEKRFSDEDIVDEFIVFFAAGMDTTGHLVGMTLYNLTQHPEYLRILQEERDSTYNHDNQLTTETLAKMEVLHAVLKESLRLHGPGPFIFFRRALYDHDLLDIKVKKGDLLTVSLITPAFDEQHFENANEFVPTRWTNPDSKLDPFAFTPFSAGPRNCIGQHLAIMEAKVIVSEFLERFDFDLKEGYQLKMTIRFLYEPEDEVQLNLRQKKTV